MNLALVVHPRECLLACDCSPIAVYCSSGFLPESHALHAQSANLLATDLTEIRPFNRQSLRSRKYTRSLMR